jgi:hypothetical protein
VVVPPAIVVERGVMVCAVVVVVIVVVVEEGRRGVVGSVAALWTWSLTIVLSLLSHTVDDEVEDDEDAMLEDGPPNDLRSFI